MTIKFSPREQVVEVLNGLFYYTDFQLWDNLQKEVFTDEVLLDMTSMGAEKAESLSSKQICDMWTEGFKGIDAIHHQPGNYIINMSENTADVKAYAIASHFRKEGDSGNETKFVGSYDFTLAKTSKGWRINTFKYNLKYTL